MADFSVNSTDLSEPQGRGASPIGGASVQPVNTVPVNLIANIGDVFAKGLLQNSKDKAEQRKNSVIGEYTKHEEMIGQSLATGQKDSSWAVSQSMSKFRQLIAAYPEYASDLMQARSAVFAGTEVGEAQKKIDAEQKLREQDMSGASASGHTFYQGMDETSKNKTIDAWKTEVRVQNELKQYREAAADARAQRADEREETKFGYSVQEHVFKENAIKGVLEIADKNFDAYASKSKDLFEKVESGKMKPEEALFQIGMDSKRIQASLNAVAAQNPELASPWNKLFADMSDLSNQMIDPSKRTASEAATLKNQFEALVTKQKLMAVTSDKTLLKTVAGTALFPGQSIIGLEGTPSIQKWVLGGTGIDPKLKPEGQIVGNPGDDKAFKTVQDSLKALQSNKIDPAKKEQAAGEALSLVNNLLKNTTTVNGQVDPRALKSASLFYSSTEFGKMALEGKIDKETATNVQHVFTVKYDPVVKDAIVKRLDEAKVGDKVEMRLVGSKVVFEAKAPTETKGGIEGLVGSPVTSEGIRRDDIRKSFSEAEAGLNQLIRMHAHLEGTTDYGKYWEDHKHELMPSVYPDPNKLKPGQVVNGFKYIGGNYRSSNNWQRQTASN